MVTSTYKINQLIQGVKRRWKQRALRQGVSYLIFAFLVFSVLFFALEKITQMTPFVRGVELVIFALVLLFIAIRYILRPLIRRIDNRSVALLIEEKVPDLEDRLNSAVEIKQGIFRNGSHLLIDQLIDDVNAQTGKIEFSTIVNRNKEKILTYCSTALLILFLVFTMRYLDDIEATFSQMDVTINPVPEKEQDFITIKPGNIQVEKGEAQEIIVEMKKKTDKDVMIHFFNDEDGWQKRVMERGLDNKSFMSQFQNIQQPMQYFVEFGREQSDYFTISIYEFPKVTQIDINYTYPEYTGVPARFDENTGDIRALRGSKADLTIETNGKAVSGKMIFKSGQEISLNKLSDNTFRTAITVNDTDTYFIQLTDHLQKQNKFPENYLIIPVPDEPPIVKITDPQKDIRANMVQEVLVEASVSDDFGVKDFSLKYSISGEDEKTARLIDAKTGNRRDINGSHLFFLEDYELQAGDVISYYVDAQDNCPDNSTEYSDMYFIEITSLDNRYSQVSNQGRNMPGSGAGRQAQSVINQQKIIAATWKLEKTRNKLTGENFKESLDAITKAQKDLKDNTEERLSRNNQPEELLDEESKKIRDYFKQAASEMEDAVQELGEEALRSAVKEEQQALTNLLRAEAMNHEKRVQMQRGGFGGQSSGGGNNQQMMEELQDLELDIAREKYEVQQQRQQARQNQEIDEALQKVQELAYRQQKLAERSRRGLQEQEDQRFLDRLKREQEQLRREAEELANQMRRNSRQNSQLSRDLQERMNDISKNMRNAEEALNRNNPEDAYSQQQMAINGLDRVTRNLQMSQSENYREMAKNFIDQFDRFKNQEDGIEKDLNRIYEDLWRDTDNKVNKTDVQQVLKKRKESLKDLKNLQEQAKTIEDQTRQEDPEVSTKLRNFQKDIQKDELAREMKTSEMAIEQGWLSSALTREYRIQDSIERLSRQVEQIESKLPLTEEEKLKRSLGDVRDLLNKYQDMEQTVREQLSRQRDDNRTDPAAPRQRSSQNQQGERGQAGTQRNQEDARRAAIARLQRQLERMNQQLDQLRRGNQDRAMRSSLRALQNNLNRLDHTGVLLDEAGLEYFKKNVYQPLSQLEYQLVKKLDKIDMDKKLASGHRAEVPAKYQKIVEKYYESIAKSKNLKEK